MSSSGTEWYYLLDKYDGPYVKKCWQAYLSDTTLTRHLIALGQAFVIAGCTPEDLNSFLTYSSIDTNEIKHLRSWIEGFGKYSGREQIEFYEKEGYTHVDLTPERRKGLTDICGRILDLADSEIKKQHDGRALRDAGLESVTEGELLDREPPKNTFH